MQYFRSRKLRSFFCALRLVIAFTLCLMFVAPPNLYAQNVFNLPTPGTMVALSPAFTPTILLGLEVDPSNPFKFQFIVDRGDQKLSQEELKKESEKVIRYFLAGLAVPEDALWVNLSPYEGDRVVDDVFGQTEMGRDLLAQDYMLKQITASLIYPEDELGRVFWQRIYKKAFDAYGTTTIPMNTFNKVWIMPDKATVYEHQNKAIIIEGDMKVMLEQDYVSLENNLFNTKLGLDRKKQGQDTKDVSTISSDVVREIVLPELYKEINTGKNFAQLRQIYNSLILANWFKQNLKQAVLNKLYSDKNKVGGIAIHDSNAVKEIYDQYLSAFKKGVCDYMKVEYDSYMKKQIPRKYFSGGYVGAPKVSVLTGPNGAQRAGSALTVIYNKAKDRIFEVSTFFGSTASNAFNKVASTVTPQKIRSSFFAAKVLPLLFAALIYANSLTASAPHIATESGKSITYVTPVNDAKSDTYDASGDLTSPGLDDKAFPSLPSSEGDKGFFKNLSIVESQQTVAGIPYENVSYSQDRLRHTTAETILYADADHTVSLGRLVVTLDSKNKFIFTPNGLLSASLGIPSGQVLVFANEEEFQLGAENLLLSKDARDKFVDNFFNVQNPKAAEDLKINQPDIYNLMYAIDEAGLVLDPNQIVSIAQQIKNVKRFKTQHSYYQEAGPYTVHEPDYYRLSILEPNGSPNGFELQLKMDVSRTRAPIWLFRVVSTSGGHNKIFSQESENFLKSFRSFKDLSQKTWSLATDFEFVRKVMGRVAAAIPADRLLPGELENASPAEQALFERIGTGMELRQDPAPGLITFDFQGEKFGGTAPAGTEEIVAHNGDFIFKVQAKNFYSQGKTVLLSDQSGTMVWQKLQVAIRAFEKVFSSSGTDKVLIGDMTDETATIVETSTKDFIQAISERSRGEGATYLQKNVLKASDLAGDYGTIIEISDDRPDDEAQKIKDWSRERVEANIFKPLLKQLQDRHQRSITYYIEKEGQPEAPLITLKKQYAAAHPENPIFFIIKHQDDTSIDNLVGKINDQYGNSELIASKIEEMTIGDMGGLRNLQVSFNGSNGESLQSFDQNKKPVNFVSNDTIKLEEVEGQVLFNFAKGVIEGYELPAGTAEVVVEGIGNQIKVPLQQKNFNMFGFVDRSKSMEEGVYGDRYPGYKTRIDGVENLYKNMSPGHKSEFIGMSFFSQGDPDIKFFNLEKDIGKQVDKTVKNIKTDGNTYFISALKKTMAEIVSHCDQTGRAHRPAPGKIDPNFEEIHVTVWTDGAITAENLPFSSDEINKLYDYGIVLDFIIIGNQLPFDSRDYVPRIKGLGDCRKAQGFFELAYGTGGNLYQDPSHYNDFGKLYTKYVKEINNSFVSDIPSGVSYVKITSYDKREGEAGRKAIKEGIYKVNVDGDLNQFLENQLRESFRQKTQEKRNEIFSIPSGQKGAKISTKATKTGEMGALVNPAQFFDSEKEAAEILKDLQEKFGILNIGTNQVAFNQIKADLEAGMQDVKTEIVSSAISQEEKNAKMIELNNFLTRVQGMQSGADLDTMIQEQVAMPSSMQGDEGQGGAASPVGGIDFNVDQFNLKTKGEGIDMNVPFDESMLQNFNPDMIAPVIIQIVPMTNPQMILGLAGEGPQGQAQQAIRS